MVWGFTTGTVATDIKICICSRIIDYNTTDISSIPYTTEKVHTNISKIIDYKVFIVNGKIYCRIMYAILWSSLPLKNLLCSSVILFSHFINIKNEKIQLIRLEKRLQVENYDIFHSSGVNLNWYRVIYDILIVDGPI
jgi:hypothetical protein